MTTHEQSLIEITIRNTSLAPVSLSISKYNTVDFLIENYASILKLPTTTIKIAYKGAILKGYMSLAAYEIQDKSILFAAFPKQTTPKRTISQKIQELSQLTTELTETEDINEFYNIVESIFSLVNDVYLRSIARIDSDAFYTIQYAILTIIGTMRPMAPSTANFLARQTDIQCNCLDSTGSLDDFLNSLNSNEEEGNFLGYSTTTLPASPQTIPETIAPLCFVPFRRSTKNDEYWKRLSERRLIILREMMDMIDIDVSEAFQQAYDSFLETFKKTFRRLGFKDDAVIDKAIDDSSGCIQIACKQLLLKFVNRKLR